MSRCIMSLSNSCFASVTSAGQISKALITFIQPCIETMLPEWHQTCKIKKLHTPCLSEHFIIFLTSFILFQWPCNAFPFIRKISYCANTPTETQLIMHEMQKLTKTLFLSLSTKIIFNLLLKFSLAFTGSLKGVCNVSLYRAMNNNKKKKIYGFL